MWGLCVRVWLGQIHVTKTVEVPVNMWQCVTNPGFASKGLQ